MKNLKLITNTKKPIKIENDIYKIANDNESNAIYALFKDGTACKINFNYDEPLIDNFHFVDTPLDIIFLSVTQEICITSANSVDIFDRSFYLASSFQIKEGCKSIGWSSGQDLFAILTINNIVKVVTINPHGDFTIINEIDLDKYKFYNQFVNVGWGSKETQFHGSEGKDARKQLKIDDLDSIEIKNGNSTITWRENDDLFAVNFLRGDSYGFVVFDKNGQPKYSSEICLGLEQPIAWRPSGNVIASVQRLPDKYQVVFFEKNGLRHRQFLLNSTVSVKTLSWSPDSEILLIEYADKKIELWSMGNYHWYLKQSFKLNCDSYAYTWNTHVFNVKINKNLHILSNQNYTSYEWIWEINCSSIDNKHETFVAVLDNCNLMLTNFKKMSIPPPMCSIKLQQTNPINFVCFSNINNNLFVVLNDYKLLLYDLKNDNYQFSSIIDLLELELNDKYPLCLNHFLYLNNSIIFANNYDLIKYNVQTNEINKHKFDNHFQNLIQIKNSNNMIVQFKNGEIYELDENLNVKSFLFNVKMILNKIVAFNLNGKLYTFVLDQLNRFYINGVNIDNNITSLCMHSHFLLMTTKKHTLVCLRLTNRAIELYNPEQVYTRQIERNAKLICAVPCDKKVILQMPRGNLETIYPRLMSIYLIANLIETKCYADAFKIMKVERINLNLLFDHNPKLFFDNVKHFIDDLSCVEHLNMFLLDLTNEDVTKTMYKNCYVDVVESRCEIVDKKEQISDAMLTILLKHNTNKYLLTVITCYVIKRTTVAIEEALKMIKSTKYLQNGEITVSFDKALDYLLLLININEIYNIALGLYDFELIMLVAAKSQKDPKEYIPFLNDLKQLDENYQKFTIDNYLKRYERALINLSKCGVAQDEELCEFVDKHKLYKDALKLFDKTSTVYLNVCRLFGDYLKMKRCFNEAGIVFEKCELYGKALEMYKLSLNWMKFLEVNKKLYGECNLVLYKKNCKELVHVLVENKQFDIAGRILLEMNDFEEGVSIFCEGKLWNDVLHHLNLNNRDDLIETNLKPGLNRHYELLKNQISSNETQFTQQFERLKQLPVKPVENVIVDEINDCLPVDQDLLSDAASVITTNTNLSKSTTSSFKSFRSSKNRRKHERKMYSLKEGSTYEDLALIRSLHLIITNTLALREEVHLLCTHLLYLELESCSAKDLQSALDNLLVKMERSTNEIWLPEMICAKTRQPILFGPDSSSNAVANAFQNDEHNEFDKYSLLESNFRYPPQFTTVHWKLFILN